MRLKFIGNPMARDERNAITMYGVTFPLGEWVDVSEMPAAERLKLAANNHFEAEVDPSEPNEVSVVLLSADEPSVDPDDAAQIAISKKLRKSRKSEG